MIGTLTVFLLIVFVLIVLRAIVPDRGICFRLRSDPWGVRSLTLLVVYAGVIICGRSCVCREQAMAVEFVAGLDVGSLMWVSFECSIAGRLVL